MAAAVRERRPQTSEVRSGHNLYGGSRPGGTPESGGRERGSLRGERLCPDRCELTYRGPKTLVKYRTRRRL